MIDWTLGITGAALDWLAAHPLASLVGIIALQIVVISALAALITNRILARQSIDLYRIWLMAVVLVLCLLPIHLALGGWRIGVVSSRSIADVAREDDGSPMLDARQQRILSQPAVSDEFEVSSATEFRASAPGDLHDSKGDKSSGKEEGPSVVLPQVSETFEAADGPSPITPIGSLSPMEAQIRKDRPSTFVIALVGVYLIGCVWCLVRIVAGGLFLRSSYRRGQPLRRTLQQRVDRIAETIGLPSAKRIRIVNGVVSPLVTGLARPLVLLPRDFESWSESEQEATLWHELMHVRRRDMIGQLLSKLATSIYWFHPATWFLDRRLMEAREWATDRQVVDLASIHDECLKPEEYAESLLNVVARISRDRSPARFASRSAIAMSAGSDLEHRLNHILWKGKVRSKRMAVLSLASMFAMLLVTLLTTARVERVVAMEPPPLSSDSGVTTSQPASPEGQETQERESRLTDKLEKVDSADGDLYSRVRDCDVLTVDGDDFHSLLTVRGQVVTSAGAPVAGAIVVLRESSGARARAEFNKYINREDRHLVRIQDVFARTTTDQDGRYEFADVKSPAFPASGRDRWRGDVVAAHENLGAGWHALPSDDVKRHIIDDMTIRLRPATTIRGRFVTPDGSPIVAATVILNGIVRPTREPMSEDIFDLYLSQLSPRVETDVDGGFEFAGVLKGFVASVSVSHPDWMLGSFTIAAGDDVPLGKMENVSGRLNGAEVLGSPAELVADPGLTITGTVVGPKQEPVAEAIVSFASSFDREKTDQDGRFALKISSQLIQRDRDRSRTTATLRVLAKPESKYLSQDLELSWDDVAAGSPVSVQLERGALVRGRVVSDDGKPASQMIVQSVDRSAVADTDSEGGYEILLPLGQHHLVVGTEQPGYAVPNRSELARGKEASGFANWPHIDVDVSDGADRDLPAIVVSRLEPVQVLVSLPGGQPVAGANVIIKDERPGLRPPGAQFVFPPSIIEKSQPALTDDQGRVEVQPLGLPSEKAFVEVKFTDDKQAYDASARLDQAVDGVLNVVLQSGWIVEGRVLIDGLPVGGATVSIGESTPLKTQAGGAMVMGSTVSSNQTAVTDADGWYRAAVRQGKEYSVFLSRLPNDSISGAIGRRPVAVEDGRLRAPDFACSRGEQTIAGTVVDAAGIPVIGANVSVRRGRDLEPSLWIGHQDESQFETDATGRFHLARIPPGSYQLSVRPPRIPGQSSSFSTEVTATAGDHNMKIVLAAAAPRPTPRLEPRRIQKLTPPSP